MNYVIFTKSNTTSEDKVRILAIETDYNEVEEWLMAFMSLNTDIDYIEVSNELVKDLLEYKGKEIYKDILMTYAKGIDN